MRDMFRQDPAVARASPESKEYRVSRILDGCLDEITSRRSTITECLTTYLDEGEQLEPLLRMAVELSSLSKLQPSVEFKDATRIRLLQLDVAPSRARVPVPLGPALPRPLILLWKPILLLVALLTGLGLALAWASLFFR